MPHVIYAPAGKKDLPRLREIFLRCFGEEAAPETARLALPRYGFEIEWSEETARQTWPIETIAARFGFRRRPAPPS